jgi:UDP-glucose 4-epimerase
VHVLVTGGCGYIGSHTVVELIDAGHRVTVVDNLCNSSAASVRAVEAIAGTEVPFVEFDVRDVARLDTLFAAASFDAVIHFAGLKAVGESVDYPLRYYDNNVGSTVALVEVMARHDVKRLVFSSSATVYGDPVRVPITEDAAIQPTNPYGRTKAVIESVLADVAAAGGGWRISRLRYFNPVGAHPSGDMGEDPRGTPNNLLPYVAQVAVGRLPVLKVYGADYDTVDKTGVRDYIHVMDLAQGHVAALEHLPEADTSEAINLGTGEGTSVLQLIAAFELASGVTIPYEITARRPGDIGTCYADPSAAARVLGWKAKRSLQEACADAWRWQSRHPNGYDA